METAVRTDIKKPTAFRLSTDIRFSSCYIYFLLLLYRIIQNAKIRIIVEITTFFYKL